MTGELERKLDSFDLHQRTQALDLLLGKVKNGEIKFNEVTDYVNLHCHSFFSYNCYGYSPSRFAWLARKAGLAVAGVVDFDVLDGLEEFLDASRKLGLKACAGMETRVFVPEFSDRVINSPGEPGISYHMGIGFPTSKLEGEQQSFLRSLGETAQQRNKELMERVNDYLRPVELDYENEVLPLTPNGNATERHICLAYASKAEKVLTGTEQLAQFWSEKLNTDSEKLALPQGRELLNTIRAKTMKRGGVGYVTPDTGSFPLMADTNRFVLAAGGIATMTWLDGTSEGEQSIEELVDVAVSTGAAAINIIPDRNYKPGVRDEKLENLYKVVELAQKRDLPIVVGTEMNSPGQKFMDSFDTKELSPLVPIFLKGAHIVYAHSVLQQKCKIGYIGDWAKSYFETVAEKNEFFERLGRLLEPEKENRLDGLGSDVTAEKILDAINETGR